MDQNRDLLGDPIPANWGGRGRPEHIPTEQNRRKIRLLLAFGWTNKRIAAALRITQPTLRKHYFAELRHRDEARDALKASHLLMVYDAARGGNVGAMKLLGQMIEADERRQVAQEFEDDAPRPPKLGKKEARAAAARAVGDDPVWGDDLNPGKLSIN